MKYKQYIVLSHFTWLVLLLTLFFNYGGFHAPKIAQNFLLWYTFALIILMNLPLVIFLLLEWIKEGKVYYFESIHLGLKFLIALLIIF